MITLETQIPLFVGTPGGERYVSGSGQWSFEGISYVTQGTTNTPTYFTNLNDGTKILVDGGGLVDVVLGPDVGYWAVNGFALAVMTLGIMMGIRWVFRRMAAAAEISGRTFD